MDSGNDTVGRARAPGWFLRRRAPFVEGLIEQLLVVLPLEAFVLADYLWQTPGMFLVATLFLNFEAAAFGVRLVLDRRRAEADTRALRNSGW